MYLVTGTLSLVSQVLMALGIFLLTLLGRAILFVCASLYTVARPRKRTTSRVTNEISRTQPFVTMYPELHDYDFDEDYEAMAKMSLETVTSVDNTSAENSPRRIRRDVVDGDNGGEGSSGVRQRNGEGTGGVRQKDGEASTAVRAGRKATVANQK